MQLSIHHVALEVSRWHWGNRCAVWDYEQHVLVRAAVRPRHAQRLCRLAQDAAAGASLFEALRWLFQQHPMLLLQGREQYVLERAQMGPSPGALHTRRVRREERAAARAVRLHQERAALEARRAQLQAMRLQDLVIFWDETREEREAAREAVLVAAQLLSEAPSQLVSEAVVSAAQLLSEAPSQLVSEARLLVNDSTSGNFGVRHIPSKSKPYQAQVRRGGKMVSLGTFVTAEEAALCVARAPEGKAAAEKVAAAQPLTGEEARRQAQVEGLTLLVTDNTAGFYGVKLAKPSQPKPYQAQLRRGGKLVSLGSFATAEEAALCVARSLEEWAAVALTSEQPEQLTKRRKVEAARKQVGC